MKIFYSSIFVFSILINSIYSQVTFEKAIDIGNYARCYDIKRIGEYNYLIGTASFSENPDRGNLVIVKVDDSGNTIWKKVFFDFKFFGATNYQFDINKANDLVITGPVYNLKSDNYSFDHGILLSIIDTSGLVKVIKTLGNGEGGTILSLDDGYLVESDNQLIKTNLDGDISWSKVTVENEQSYGLFLSSGYKSLDKKVIIVGFIAYHPVNKIKQLIAEIDLLGNIDWIKKYSSDYLNFYPNKIIQTSDSGFVVTGMSVPKLGFDPPRPLYIMKTNKNGEILWCKSYEFSERTDIGYDVIETNDENLIICGAINQTGVNEDFLILKINRSGELIWAKSYGGNSWDEGKAVISTNDGFIATGLTSSFSENTEFFLIKFDSFGDVNESKSSLNPKINDVIINVDVADSIFKNDNNFISDNITLKNYRMPNAENYVSSIFKSYKKAYKIYPNPVDDLFQIDGLTKENDNYISIYNMQGLKVYENVYREGNIDIRNLIRGVYVMEVQTKRQIDRFKIVKK